MDRAKPGHTVEFQGLKGAAHLNGTQGTLVKFLKKEQRWSVRCAVDNKIVNAKPDNLVLQRLGGRPIIGSDITAARASQMGLTGPSAWANGLSQSDQYEWFSNCYQMRCDDDYCWGGGNLHGPYKPDATPESIADDFLVYCVLARRADAVPRGWDWAAFLKAASKYIAFAFEKSDAKERWGGENVFQAAMGGRSLRYTGEEIYKSPVNQPFTSDEHKAAENDVESNKDEIQKQVGGTNAWANLPRDLGRCNRFSY